MSYAGFLQFYFVSGLVMMFSVGSQTLSLIDQKSPSISQDWIAASMISAASLSLTIGFNFIPTPTCKWCAVNGFDESVATALVSDNLSGARLTSNVLTFGLIPIFSLASLVTTSLGPQDFLKDLSIVFASVVTSSAMTNVLKGFIRRSRPEVMFGISGNNDQNRSFPSGHSSFAASSLAAISTLAFRKGHPWAPYITGISAILASSVGYSRIASAKHWLTDIMAGLGVGAAVGIILPYLLTKLKKKSGIITSFYVASHHKGLGLQVGMSW